MPFGSTARYRHQELASVPRGYHVRTVRTGSHLVRVAFPPGRRDSGAGVPVSILHPKGENPCPVAQRNPAELVLMSANPARTSPARGASRGNNVYDALSVNERLAFGRLGLGKAQIQTRSDLSKARRMVMEAGRLRNRLPNPGVDSPEAEQARERYEGFHARGSEKYVVADEPHIPAGDYTYLGKLIALRVKPHPAGSASGVQEMSFPEKNIRVICDPSGRQIYFSGDGQEQSEEDLRLFNVGDETRISLGDCRSIVYEATKWHTQLAPSARGEKVEWEHTFGEEGGSFPVLFYDRAMKRLLLTRASYRVEPAGIVN